MTGLEIGALIAGILGAAGAGTQVGMDVKAADDAKKKKKDQEELMGRMSAMERVAQSRIDRRNRLASGSPLASGFTGSAPRMPMDS